ncbi:MAG TPA: hypothetical protein VJR06_06490, partial [Nitrososphaerales archaeon]|nr:hypothetical protein [Nitrososphaerales archaeon]
MAEKEPAEEKAEPTRSGQRAAYTDELKYSLTLLLKNKLVLGGIVMSIFFIVIAALATVLVNPASAYKFNLAISYCWSNPFFTWSAQSATCPSNVSFPLGSDGYGRDLVSMIILAIPLDLSIALEVVATALVIGIVLGAVAGFLGGWIDEAILRITDIFFAFPFLIL